MFQSWFTGCMTDFLLNLCMQPITCRRGRIKRTLHKQKQVRVVNTKYLLLRCHETLQRMGWWTTCSDSWMTERQNVSFLYLISLIHFYPTWESGQPLNGKIDLVIQELLRNGIMTTFYSLRAVWIASGTTNYLCLTGRRVCCLKLSNFVKHFADPR